MTLDLFYTMVQKSQKWPKTQSRGGGSLSFIVCNKWLFVKIGLGIAKLYRFDVRMHGRETVLMYRHVHIRLVKVEF